MTNDIKQKYGERVQYFVGFFKKLIKKRSWFDDLNRFDPGENFFDKVLKADENSAKDKQDFYRVIVKPLYDTLKQQFGDRDAAVRSGIIIDPIVAKTHEKEQHEHVLGYEWWIRIYNLARRENRFDAEEMVSLEYKRKQLFNQMESLKKS